MVYRNNGGTFGDAVAVEHVNTKSGQEVHNFCGNRCAARNYHFHLAAEALKNRAEKLLSDSSSEVKHVTELHHALDGLFFTLFLDSCHDFTVERLKIKRNKHEVTGMLLLQLLCDVSDARGDVNLAAYTCLTENGHA